MTPPPSPRLSHKPPLLGEGDGARLRAIVAVDLSACVGTDDCARLAPAAFRVREDDLVAEVLAAAARADLRLLREVVAACPMQAISVTVPPWAGARSR
jgi:ferredoxin